MLLPRCCQPPAPRPCPSSTQSAPGASLCRKNQGSGNLVRDYNSAGNTDVAKLNMTGIKDAFCICRRSQTGAMNALRPASVQPASARICTLPVRGHSQHCLLPCPLALGVSLQTDLCSVALVRHHLQASCVNPALQEPADLEGRPKIVWVLKAAHPQRRMLIKSYWNIFYSAIYAS